MTDEELERRIKTTLLSNHETNDINVIKHINSKMSRSIEYIKKLHPYTKDIITLSDSNVSTLEQLIDDIIKTNNPKRD